MDDALLKKLGWRAGRRLAVIGIADDLSCHDNHPDDPADILLYFVPNIAALAELVGQAIERYQVGQALWFAYPKKSGSITTDLSRDHGWTALTSAGLIPVSQVAVDADWSALRFRYRDEVKRLTRKQDLPGT